MLFPTVSFATFFAVVFVLSWLTRSRPNVWRGVILISSFIFYACSDLTYAFGLVVLAFVNAQIAHRVSTSLRPRPWLVLAVVLDLLILCTFKYLGFFGSIASHMLRAIGIVQTLALPQFVLPLGVSFVTFQLISYIVDVSRGDTKAVPWYDVLLYVSFFPHLVAGPIVRAKDFLPQIEQPLLPDALDRAKALWLIMGGLFKKVVIATYLAKAIVDPVFAEPELSSALQTLIGVYAYAVQIYADFSGYTDIAIGVALLLGVRFPQNFKQPYAQSSLQNFWRSWHITLSEWLRNYLYISLGGSKGSRLATYRNLVLTMVLGGLWHGAAMKFILWGLIHGLWLAVERIALPKIPTFKLRKPVGTLLTFHVVCAGWIFFRAADTRDAFTMFRQLASHSTSAPLVTNAVLVTVGAMLGAQFLNPSRADSAVIWLSNRGAASQSLIFAAALIAIDILGPTGVAPFIYFQF